jgi:hypothetical protein
VDGNKPSIVVAYTEILNEPLWVGNQNVKVVSITVKGFFDKTSEDFYQIQTILSLEDGGEIYFETTTVVEVTSASNAPEEVLEVLRGVK